MAAVRFECSAFSAADTIAHKIFIIAAAVGGYSALLCLCGGGRACVGTCCACRFRILLPDIAYKFSISLQIFFRLANFSFHAFVCFTSSLQHVQIGASRVVLCSGTQS